MYFSISHIDPIRGKAFLTKFTRFPKGHPLEGEMWLSWSKREWQTFTADEVAEVLRAATMRLTVETV